MQFLLEQSAVDEMERQTLTDDCYAHERNFPHHLYRNGEKCLVVRALYNAIDEAKAAGNQQALTHLVLHDAQVRSWVAERDLLKQGKPLPPEMPSYTAAEQNDVYRDTRPAVPVFLPPHPTALADLHLSEAFVHECILRVIYFKGAPTGSTIGSDLRIPFYGLLSTMLEKLRAQELIDIAGQVGLGEAGYMFVLTPKGSQRVQDLLTKTAYNGPLPVPFTDFVASIRAQTIKNLIVTRNNIRKAFADLIISDHMFQQIGPAVNSGSSIFFFGAAGNGKTSIAERITHLMGDHIYLPHAVESDGQVIKVFDPITHEAVKEENGTPYDQRWVKIKRPVVVVGGELTLESLDLIYNESSKVYEAPFQMKANGGIFMIDDFGRQLCRPQELLNRWIVPLEKRYDYLTLATGKKLEVPFDQLIVFSTNLDPSDLADEAFLRRIKYKINVVDPTEEQFRRIFKLVSKGRKVPYDDKGIDYLIERWYTPTNRPFRSCQPRDILDQMIALAKYNMEPATLTPDLIDNACATYFIKPQNTEDATRARPKF